MEKTQLRSCQHIPAGQSGSPEGVRRDKRGHHPELGGTWGIDSWVCFPAIRTNTSQLAELFDSFFDLTGPAKSTLPEVALYATFSSGSWLRPGILLLCNLHNLKKDLHASQDYADSAHEQHKPECMPLSRVAFVMPQFFPCAWLAQR